jgi:hypothetical protein
VQSATKAPSTGDQLEARVAQTWFWEGFYVRRGVNFQRYYQEPLQVTDLDLFAFDFNPQLVARRYIGEVKSGSGKSAPKPLDRIIWLAGLRTLVNADRGELTSALTVSPKARALGRGLSITAQHVTDLERRERDAVNGLRDMGSQGVTAFALETRVREICKNDADLERAFGYLRGEALLLEPFLAAKQLIELLRRLSSHWTPNVQDDDKLAVRWLAAEATSILTLHFVSIAGQATTLDRPSWDALVNERLAEGALPAHQMRKLSDSLDKYVSGLMAAANAPADLRTQAIGAFLPEAPDYADPFAELCWRLKSDAPAARVLPRQLDFIVFERLVHQRNPDPTATGRLGLARDGSTRFVRLVSGFIRGCGASFSELDEALASTFSSSGERQPVHGRETRPPQ